MTNSKQTEALRLVNNRHNAHMLTWQANACAELRRLHALNQELVDFAEEYVVAWDDGMAGDSSLLRTARAVLAKASGSATQTGEAE